jgi:hypothetical protein
MEDVTQFKLEQLFLKNTQNIQSKILKKLQSKPSPEDRQGYIYGFDLPEDDNDECDFLIKLGRTELSTPQVRIGQWNGCEVFTKVSNFNRKLERLIHLFFDFARFHRVRNGQNEIEWFKFDDNHKITSNMIVRYVLDIDDLMSFVHNKYSLVAPKLKTSTKLRCTTTSIKATISAQTIMAPEVISELQNIIKLYSGSCCFHVKPRKQILSALENCMLNDTDGSTVPLDKQSVLKSYISMYNGSNTFHVGPRKEIFKHLQIYLSTSN